MLVLSRKKAETITIGPDITITIVETRPGTVRLGIDAPREMAIHRGEVVDVMEGAGHTRSEITEMRLALRALKKSGQGKTAYAAELRAAIRAALRDLRSTAHSKQ